METIARNLKQVNTAIKRKYPTVGLAKSEGCFYVFSDDTDMESKLSLMPTTTIYVCFLNHLTVDEWVRQVGDVVAEAEKRYTEENTPYVDTVPSSMKPMYKSVRIHQAE